MSANSIKIVLVTSVLLQAFSMQAQAKRVKVGVQFNADILKPYSRNVSKELKSNTQSSTWSASLTLNALHRSKLNWYIGFSYKTINYLAKDRISQFNYSYQTGSQGQGTWHDVYHTYKDPADLQSYSRSAGIINEVDYLVLTKDKFSGTAGMQAEVYLYENFESKYVSTDYVVGTNSTPVGPLPLVKTAPHKFFLSGVNTSVFFRLAFYEEKPVNLSVKISLGTNLYSDWDQFSRYAWLGLGLEIGFGNIRMKERKVD